MSARHSNGGIHKVCGCARSRWTRCTHPWHFAFQLDGDAFRLSLERRIGRLKKNARGRWERDRSTLGERLTTKTEAEAEADRLRSEIRAGRLQQQAAPAVTSQRDTLTLSQLLRSYMESHLAVNHGDTLDRAASQIRVISRTELQRLNGTPLAFGDWLVVDITSDTLEQFQRVRALKGVTAGNRDLSLIRAAYGWAVRRDHIERSPFKRHGEVVVKLVKETARRRRLRPGEGERLLAAAGPHLRAVIEAALETGCRKGELLSLQWWQVRFEPHADILLPATKTKTKTDRVVPMSTRLKAILEMRRVGPDGEPLSPDAYVFGNEVGERVTTFKRAGQRAVLVAHGQKPIYAKRWDGEGEKRRLVTGTHLAPESQAALRAIGLHFHDLRREAGSRWLDHGVPLHTIRAWLGHANISQTSTYLMAEAADGGDVMRRFEARRAALQPFTSGDGNHGETRPPGATGADENTQET